MGKADYIANGYGYRTDEQGRVVQAYGELRLTDDPQRDGKAQREAGGNPPQPGDDGGHYIGTRFDGSPGAENLFAQNQVVNRSDYKRLENSWARSPVCMFSLVKEKWSVKVLPSGRTTV